MRKALQLPRLEPTEESVFLNRRRFLETALLAGAGTCLFPLPGVRPSRHRFPKAAPCLFPLNARRCSRPSGTPVSIPPISNSPTAWWRRPITISTSFFPIAVVRSGNIPATLKWSPGRWRWAASVTSPAPLNLDDLFGFEQEERVYRFRCVETWAMNIPWTGFPLSRLLKVCPAHRQGPARPLHHRPKTRSDARPQ